MLLYTTETINLIDESNPIGRLEHFFKNHNKEKKGILLTLLIMYEINKIMKNTFKVTTDPYIFKDASIMFVIKNITNPKISDERLKKILILLQQSGLIYRFTCARKFKIKDKSLKQLRINSWGNEYIKLKKLTQKFPKEVSGVHKLLKGYFLKKRIAYEKLLEILIKAPKNNMIEIKKLNEELDIKLLS